MSSCVGCSRNLRRWGRTTRKVSKARKPFSNKSCSRSSISSPWVKVIIKIKITNKIPNKTTPTTPPNLTNAKTFSLKIPNRASPNSLSITFKNPSQELSTRSHSTRTVPIGKKTHRSCPHHSKAKETPINSPLPTRMLPRFSTNKILKVFNSSLPSRIR